MKKILVLGGTMFVGRALVEQLIAMPEYEVTLFNRGKSNAGLFPGVKQIHGNRETDDILQVCNQHWDCVLDFSGYYPLSFEKLLNALKGKVGRYIFVSTISVYDLENLKGKLILETDDTLYCSEVQKTSKLPDAYGEKKAEMERILLQHTELDKIILRPSFIYGRYDWTERFYYWLYRAKFFDRIMMPDNFGLSLTYSEDLASAILNSVETKHEQTIYNTISQPDSSLREVVNTAASLLNKKVELVEAHATMLEKTSIHGSEFPLYVPFNFTIQGAKWFNDFAVTAVDFKSSIAATIEYHEAMGWPLPKAGLSVAKEKDLLGLGV